MEGYLGDIKEMEATLKKKQNGRPGLRNSWARQVPSLNSHKKREERMDPTQACVGFYDAAKGSGSSCIRIV